jgi:predicted DNA-binding protein (MmcQ/YjbR family)
MPRTLHDAIPQLCLAFPDAEQFVSHGAPNFRVRGGNTFAVYAVNHHGDGRIALWLNAPPGAQHAWVGAQPQHYFVPPYVGPRGWLGVQLDRGLAWSEIVARVREAHAQVAAHRQRADDDAGLDVAPPDTALSAAQVDPLQADRARHVIARLRAMCLVLPEVTEALQFGTPTWRAGKKTFAGVHAYDGPLRLTFWVGVERQALMTADPRFTIPAYLGHNGWIALDVSQDADWNAIEALLHDSYRHFALKRMLAQLDGGQTGGATGPDGARPGLPAHRPRGPARKPR